jgi:hypothetical protein
LKEARIVISLCWWCNFLRQWSEENTQNIFEIRDVFIASSLSLNLQKSSIFMNKICTTMNLRLY